MRGEPELADQHDHIACRVDVKDTNNLADMQYVALERQDNPIVTPQGDPIVRKGVEATRQDLRWRARRVGRRVSKSFARDRRAHPLLCHYTLGRRLKLERRR